MGTRRFRPFRAALLLAAVLLFAGFTPGPSLVTARSNAAPAPLASPSAVHGPAEFARAPTFGPVTSAPLARISVTLNGSPVRAAAPLTANFTAQASVSGATNFTLLWAFGDGSANETFNLTASGGTATLRTNHTFAAQGSYVVNVSATDNVAGERGSGTLLVTVGAPFAVAINLTPAHPIAGRAVVITPVVSGGFTPYHAAWTGVPADCYAGAFNLTCVPGAPGNYSVRLTVTDATIDRYSEDIFLNVVPRLLVSASYKSAFSCSGATGIAVYNFTAVPTGGDPPVNYTWTIGNGVTPSYGAFVSVVLPLNQQFEVTVSALDAIGEAASATLTVSTSFPACGAVPPPNYAPPRLLLIGAVVAALGVVGFLGYLLWRSERARRPPPAPSAAVPPGAQRPPLSPPAPPAPEPAFSEPPPSPPP